MVISHCYWHLVIKNGNFTFLLTSRMVSDIKSSRMAISWQFHTATGIKSVKNGNFTLLLTSSGQEWQFHIATTSSDMAIYIATDHLWRMAISHFYWHLVVKNGNFTLLLTSSGRFSIGTDIKSSRMAISHFFLTYSSRMVILHCYWHLVIKNGNFTLLLTSSGQEWQFHIATDI